MHYTSGMAHIYIYIHLFKWPMAACAFVCAEAARLIANDERVSIEKCKRKQN